MTFEQKQVVILSALRELGPGWHTRGEIAARLNKARLNGADATILDMLAALGEIEKDIQPSSLPHIQNWIYRIKGGEEPEK